MSKRLHGCLAVSLLAVCVAGVSVFANAQSRPLITSKIDNASRIMVEHSRHPLANSLYDVGQVRPDVAMQRLILVLGPGSDQETSLRDYLASQQDSSSPNYHHWLTPDEFGQRFGANAQDVQQVTRWLQQQGFTIGAVARSRRWLEFSGTAQQVESAFHTQMRRYRVNGEEHLANATDISFPAALSPVVRGVLSLHNFFHKPLLARQYKVARNAAGKLVPADPEFTLSGFFGTFHYLAPGDFAGIYNLSPLYQSGVDGTGQTIAIVARSNLELSDVETFRRIFNLPPNDPVFVLNGPDPGILGGDFVEASLDVEWSGAVAPKATVDLVISASTVTTDGVDLSAAYIVDNNLAPVMSESYGACEQDLGPSNAFYNSLWQQAAAEGISVFVSSGDNGAAGCDDPGSGLPAQRGLAVSGLASTPYNTAVGGTQFNENGNDTLYWNNTNGPGFASANGYIPEAVWNESCDSTVPNSPCAGFGDSLFAGSGGASTLYAKPAWQAGTNVPNDGHRDLPDVSLTAAGGHDGYLLCILGFCQTGVDSNGQPLLESAFVVGGTSASSPAFAGIMSLVNQKTGGRQGLANYVLYQLATTQDFNGCNSSNLLDPSTPSQCIFYDITAGNNTVPGLTGYNAGPAFDLATGLGSVNAANLVNSWTSLALPTSTTLSADNTPISGQHGQSVKLKIEVKALSGYGTPSGSVALMTDKYGSAGTFNVSPGAFDVLDSSLPGGQYNLFAHYQGDGTFGASDSNPIPVNITPEDSSLSLTAYAYDFAGPHTVTTAPYGSFIYLHSKVQSASGNGFATGRVTYQDSSTPIGTITLNNEGEGELVSGGNFVSCFNLCLAVGTHSLTASYPGDNSLNASATPQPLTITITKADPFAFFLDDAPVNMVSTQTLLLHNIVLGTGSILPTGTLQYYDGNTPIGSPVSISAPVGSYPQATLQTMLSPGVHTITAAYSGDDVYNSATTFDSVQVTVTAPAGTPTQTTASTDTQGPFVVGQQVNFLVTVGSSQSSPAPTGTVSLILGSLGDQAWTQATLQNGSATIPIALPFAGKETAVVEYSGDSSYAASASVPIAMDIAKATPSLSLTSNAQVVQAGHQVSIAVTLSFPPPGPSFYFPCNPPLQLLDALNGAAPQPLGPGQLFLDLIFTAGQVECTTAIPEALPYGTHVITAQYPDTPDYKAVTANPVTVIVTRQATTTALSSSANPSSFGQSVTFTATLATAAGKPTGQVVFTDDGTPIDTEPLNGPGPVTFTTSNLAVASHPIAAAYSGDAFFADSISAVTQVVNKDATALTIVSSANPATKNEGITLTANGSSLFGTAPTGSVSFYDGSNPLGTAGVGSPLSISFSTPAPHTITATYQGDATHSGTSAILQQVVYDSGTTVTSTTLGYTAALPAPPSSPLNQQQVLFRHAITLTAAVSPIPTGTAAQVVFVDGSNILGGAVPNTSGKAVLLLKGLSVGPHSITAYYIGDSTYAGSQQKQAVNQSARPR
jgi:hypothetical protein